MPEKYEDMIKKIQFSEVENKMDVVDNVDYVRGLLSNNSGKMAWSNFVSSLLSDRERLHALESNGNGPGLLGAKVGFVFAYDSTNISKYLLYAYIRNDGAVANRIIIASNGLSLGLQNNQGSSVVNGADTQICIYISQ